MNRGAGPINIANDEVDDILMEKNYENEPSVSKKLRIREQPTPQEEEEDKKKYDAVEHKGDFSRDDVSGNGDANTNFNEPVERKYEFGSDCIFENTQKGTTFIRRRKKVHRERKFVELREGGEKVVFYNKQIGDASDEEEEESENESSGEDDLRDHKTKNRRIGFSFFYFAFLFAILMVYLYLTIPMINLPEYPEDVYKPAFLLRTTTTTMDIFDTICRNVTSSEIVNGVLHNYKNSKGRVVGSVHLSDLEKTLDWYSKARGFEVICAHHLLHSFGIPPSACLIRNDKANQVYFMINPKIIGNSMEREIRIEDSLACGTGVTTVERYKSVFVSWIQKDGLHMYSQFFGGDSANLQTVIDEINGKTVCKVEKPEKEPHQFDKTNT